MKRPKLEDLVIFEDDDYLSINKPPFLSTLEDRNDTFNALSLVRDQYPEIKVCHRIDKETSGCLLFAKNQQAYSHAASNFEKRNIYKEYHAVIEGRVELEDRMIEDRIRVLGNGKVCIDYYGKEASTTFDSLELFSKHTLVRCLPHSGRMHQIRIHVAHKGTPIVGDVLYGGSPFYLSSIKKKFSVKKGTEEEPLIKRFALHAKKLLFEAPQGHEIEIEAEYPKDFRVLLTQLRRNA